MHFFVALVSGCCLGALKAMLALPPLKAMMERPKGNDGKKKSCRAFRNQFGFQHCLGGVQGPEDHFEKCCNICSIYNILKIC